jgi:DNA ligase 1
MCHPMSIQSETHFFEFPVLYKEKRVWKIFIRLIKADSQANFSKVDWNLMEETQVPILPEYITDSKALPADIIAELWTETGQVNGKITRSIPTYPLEKNKEKKNYRNCFQQAISVAESKHKKKREEGFLEENSFVSVSDTDKVGGRPKDAEALLPVFPMLAKPFSGTVKFPVLVQPKLDGLRCVAFLDHSGRVVLQSRTKKIFPNNTANDRIRKELEKVFKIVGDKFYLDGELYNHTTKLQTLNHYARGSDTGDNSILQYHIYDAMSIVETTFFDRVKILEKIPSGDIIQVVETKQIESRETFDQAYREWIDYGFEGMMIRDPNGVYQFGKRSGYLMKRKEVFTDEFPIVDYTSGTNGKDLNALIWVCSTTTGIHFKVTPNLTYEERYQLFQECQNNFTHYKNRLLTVEYRGLSIDRVPQHAKAVCIRDIE